MTPVGFVGVEHGHAQMRVACLARVAITALEQGLGIHILLGQHVVDIADFLNQRLRINAMFLVVSNLLGAATISLVNRLAHGISGLIGIHDYRA